jgi:tellurite resistance protein
VSEPTEPKKPVSHNGKRRIYRILCHLAWCDGELHPNERMLLETFAIYHGIRPDEAGDLETEGKDAKELGVSKRPSERSLLVNALIDIAAADGKLVAPEQKRLLKFGATIGLTEQEIASRIVERIQRSGKILSPSKRYERPPES